MKTRNQLPANCSKQEFEQTCKFLNKVKEMDEERGHRGIFLKYINLMKLYQSGSLNVVDVKTKVTTIFKNCDVLLRDFHKVLKCNDFLANLKRVKQLAKKLKEEQKQGFNEAFLRYKVHDDLKILKYEVESSLRGHNLLKEEFREILVYNGLLNEITFKQEDEMYEADMFFEGLKSAIRFCEEGGDEEKPSVGVYGAMTRFYKQRRKSFKKESMMKNPKLAIESVLPALKRKYLELEEERSKSLKLEKEKAMRQLR